MQATVRSRQPPTTRVGRPPLGMTGLPQQSRAADKMRRHAWCDVGEARREVERLGEVSRGFVLLPRGRAVIGFRACTCARCFACRAVGATRRVSVYSAGRTTGRSFVRGLLRRLDDARGFACPVHHTMLGQDKPTLLCAKASSMFTGRSSRWAPTFTRGVWRFCDSWLDWPQHARFATVPSAPCPAARHCTAFPARRGGAQLGHPRTWPTDSCCLLTQAPPGCALGGDLSHAHSTPTQ